MVLPATIVTGGSRGIGYATAEKLLARGHSVTINGRDEDSLGLARQSLDPARVDAFAGDVADDGALKDLVSFHLERWGRIDSIVMSAGFGTAGRFETYDVRKMDAQYRVNLRSAFVLAQLCLPFLRTSAAERAKAGRIVAIASITGVVAEVDLAAYGAVKAGLVSLCESISASESSNGVSATAVCPGYVDTDLTAWVHDQVSPEQMIPASDVAEIVASVISLTSRTVVPSFVLTRAGESLWRA